jgi:DNA-binding CsgD family transcriptional regulator
MVWLPRCNVGVPPVTATISGPYQLELDGNWQAAARAWGEMGCVYEQALALLAGDEGALRESLDRLRSLGAMPAAAIARRRLHDLGAAKVPRGPQRGTRADPHGLTRREREIFDLLVQGHSSPEIAARLHRSQRTVEHHVAGVLAKMGVNSRAALLELTRRSH